MPEFEIKLTVNLESELEQRALLDSLGGINERLRQIREEGYTAENDDKYTRGQLVKAALCYASPAEDRFQNPRYIAPVLWPWHEKHWKPTPHDRSREIDKAIALLLAEKARLKRLEEKKEAQNE